MWFMKNKKNILFLAENGLSSTVISKLNDQQVRILVEKFKKLKKIENKEQVTITKSPTTQSQTVTATGQGSVVLTTQGKQVPLTVDGTVTTTVDPTTKIETSESEMTEDVNVDKDDATAGQISQDPHQVQAPDGMDDLGDATIDKEEDLATEGEIKEKFESKAQQGLFWARCNKCSDKKCKWCKMAKEFSDSTSKKQYKNMPEKKHPTKTVKYKKKETKENLQEFLEQTIISLVEKNIEPKMSKKDLIEAIKKKSKSMIIRRPKKLNIFSDESPMKLPIGKIFSAGKK
jgi:hypothetical protein